MTSSTSRAGACMTARGPVMTLYRTLTARPKTSWREPRAESCWHSAGLIHFWLTTPALILSLGNCLAKAVRTLAGATGSSDSETTMPTGPLRSLASGPSRPAFLRA